MLEKIADETTKEWRFRQSWLEVSGLMRRRRRRPHRELAQPQPLVTLFQKRVPEDGGRQALGTGLEQLQHGTQTGHNEHSLPSDSWSQGTPWYIIYFYSDASVIALLV